MGLFKSKTSFIPRKNRNGTTTAGQYSQYGISQSSNGGTSSQKEDLSDIYKRLEEKLDSNKVGTANGAASLDENGKVPTDQLPSYVDDVVEYETLQDFPSPGETGKIYISTSTNKTYRWSGSQYIDISSASDDCLLKSSKISDNEIGTIVAGGDVTSADNYLNNRGLKSLWAYITAAANDIVANLSTMIAAKQDAISVTTKSDTPTGNDTVIMQANGTNNTKTFLRRKLSDLWNFFKTQEYPEAYLGWGGKHISGSFAPVDAALVDMLGANRTAIYPANCIDILYSRDKGNTWIDYGASDSIKRRLFSTGVSSNDIVIGKSTSEEMADENSMLRIIFKSRADGSSSNVLYAQLKKFAIYVSTNGSNGVKCTVDALRADRYDSGEDNWTIFANEAPISGWSGWNIINLGNTLTTAGNDSQKTGQYRYVRFTFSNTSRTGTSKGLSILRIYSYGLNCWNAPNSLATRGTLYNYDDTQNATFPAKIYVQNSANNEVYYKGGTDVSVADGGTGASTAIGAEYNILNQVQDTDVAINDNRKIALCNQTKSSTAGVFRWLKMSNVWTYIKGKIDSAYSSVLGSGITSSKVSSYDTHLSNNDVHVTSSQKTSWDSKQDAISVTTKSDTPTDNETVIMQANGSNDTKTYLRRKMSDVWTYIKGKIDSAYSSVLGSGITSSKVSSYDTHIADTWKHVTSEDKHIIEESKSYMTHFATNGNGSHPKSKMFSQYIPYSSTYAETRVAFYAVLRQETTIIGVGFFVSSYFFKGGEDKLNLYCHGQSGRISDIIKAKRVTNASSSQDGEVCLYADFGDLNNKSCSITYSVITRSSIDYVDMSQSDTPVDYVADYDAICLSDNDVSSSTHFLIDDEDADFSVMDENGNVILELKGGHIRTQQFDSRLIAQTEQKSSHYFDNDDGSDFSISDVYGNKIVEFKDGHIRTKNFDSRRSGSGNGVTYENVKNINV